jgi:hypothetical protein
MELDVQRLFKAYEPTRPLILENTKDRSYYIDFSSVRGGEIIREFQKTITILSPDEPTCQLFTGHIGCGKSTELFLLKSLLEQQGFHVVYFESNLSLQTADVDVTDILIAIACKVDESLKENGINLEPNYFANLITRTKRFWGKHIDILEFGLPGIATISARTKNSPELHRELREYLEPRTTEILAAINKEIIEEAIKLLKKRGKQGLVVIIDNLDIVGTNKIMQTGQTQLENLFIERGGELRQLNCHLVYIISLALMRSTDLPRLTERFGCIPAVLPMVPVELRDGGNCEEGIALLRQMVLARAFPEFSPEQRLEKIPELFDCPATLDRICSISGGHVRGLIEFVRRCIQKQMKLPLSAEFVEATIKERCNQISSPLTDEHWDILRQVSLQKRITGEEKYRSLVRTLYIFEYWDTDGSWSDINPILKQSRLFKS